MDASIKRRIHIATSWASSRIGLLDSVERYEDSYAINQEFCEWITGINNHPKEIEKTLLKVPNSKESSAYLMTRRKDGREIMRPVSVFVDNWVCETITQDLQPKTTHVRNDAVVGYL